MHLGTVQDEVTLFLRWIVPEGARVLDVGCGTGGLCHGLAELGADVLGVEPHPTQLQCAQVRSSGARFLSGEAHQLPVDDGWATVVIFNRSLHHVPVELQRSALDEARRALGAGGTLIVAEPDPEGSWSRLQEPFHDERVVRAAAQAALDHVTPRFASRTRVTYDRELRFPDRDAFTTRVGQAVFNAIDRDALTGPLVGPASTRGGPRRATTAS